jgi:uracil-DNA glycosylase
MTEPEQDPRAEFRSLVEAFRAHLAWQAVTGASGLPAARGKAPSASAAKPEPGPPTPRTSESPAPASGSLAEVARVVASCTRCRLAATRTQTVFARGTGTSRLCFVGEGPGADEDAQGEPFVGLAGQLLDRMIQAMGFSRDEVYVCNIVKCRPPENRKPDPDEMAACRPFLETQLELVAPEVIVALGATAVQGLLGTTEGITRLRGRWKLYQGRIAVMPTFHPAYLLRNPKAKREVWEDLQAVLRQMGRTPPGRP